VTLLRKLDLPPVWGALAWALIWLWSRALPIAPLPPGVAPLGRLAIAAGLGFVLWAAPFFFRFRTPIEPRHTPRVLITDGPYRLTRNPIYRGLVWATAGWAIVCGEATALAVAAGYAWLLLKRFALPEEAVLIATFGEDFRAWAARTRSRL
jgi:protein-S-isoprenylcysteine O-methyltransferase Ste14